MWSLHTLQSLYALLLLLLLGFTSLLNILGHQHRFQHRAWKGRQILLRGSNFGLRFFYVASNLRYGSHGFTFLPKEVILRIFTLWKIHRPRPGWNPRTSVSMRRDMESKRPWISSWRISLHAVCTRVHKASRVGAGGPWRISRWPTISQGREAVIPVVFGRRLAQSLPRVAGHCPAEIWHVELPEGGAVPRAVKPP